MTSDRDLDLVLQRWIVSELPQRAPAAAIQAALSDVASTPQRRFRRPIGTHGGGRRRLDASLTWRRAGVVGLLAAAAIGVVLGIGALRQHPDPSPSLPSTSPGPAPSNPASGRQIDIPQHGLELRVPNSWQPDTSRTTVVFVSGENPAGQMSVYHGSPVQMMLCDPECATVELTDYLPQAPERTIEDITRVLSERTGASGWYPAEGVSGRIKGAQRLDVLTGEPPGRRSYLVGTYLSEIVVAVVTMPDGPTAIDGTASLLAGVQPYPAAFAPLGQLIRYADITAGIQMRVPDIWPEDVAPPAPGTRNFGEGRVSVAMEDATGSLSICDPRCRTIRATDLASLESATFVATEPGISNGEIEMSGVLARYQRIDAPREAASYRVIALLSGRLTHLWVDLSRDIVDPSIAVDIAESFEYLPAGQTVRVGGTLVGRGFELDLPSYWQGSWNVATQGGIHATAGDDAGRLWSCRWSGWGSTMIPCGIVEATTLDDLVRRLSIPGEKEDAELDGEPAVVMRVETYEHPARGGQWLVFVAAVHEGRPYVIRLHNRNSETFHLDEVLAGFRFTE